MRIAFIVTEYVTESNFMGGLANYTHRIACSLKVLGHIPEIFVVSNRSETIIHDGVKVHRVAIKMPFLLKIFCFINKQLFRDFFKNLPIVIGRIYLLQKAFRLRHSIEPFDLVHYTHLSGTGALRNKIPSIVRLSSYSDLCMPYGYDYRFTNVFIRWIEDFALKRADAVICPSNYVANYVEKKLNIKTKVIESPFLQSYEKEDDSVFQKQWLNQQGKYRSFGLYFGSLAEWKGVFILSDALTKFLSYYPDMGFIFIGRDLSVKEGLPASYWISSRLSDYKDQLLIIQPIIHSQLYSFLKNAAFIVLPSLADNLPNTLIESLGMRKVVIGTRGRSFDQMIKDGENGLLCEPGDVVSLFNAMKRAMSLTSFEKMAMGELAYERVKQLLPDKIGKQHEEFYLNVLKSRKYAN